MMFYLGLSIKHDNLVQIIMFLKNVKWLKYPSSAQTCILHYIHLLLTNMMQDNDFMWYSLWMHLYATNIQDEEVVLKYCMGFCLVFISYANPTRKSAVVLLIPLNIMLHFRHNIVWFCSIY